MAYSSTKKSRKKKKIAIILISVISLGIIAGLALLIVKLKKPTPYVEPDTAIAYQISQDGKLTFAQSNDILEGKYDHENGRKFVFDVLGTQSELFYTPWNYGDYKSEDGKRIIEVDLNSFAKYTPNEIFHIDIKRYACNFRLLYLVGPYIDKHYNQRLDVNWQDIYFTVDENGVFHKLEDSFQNQVESITTMHELENTFVKGATIFPDNYFVITLENSKQYTMLLPHKFTSQIDTSVVGNHTATYKLDNKTFTYNYKVVDATIETTDTTAKITQINLAGATSVALPAKIDGKNVELTSSALEDIKNVKKLSAPLTLSQNSLQQFTSIKELSIPFSGLRVSQLFGGSIPATLKTIKIYDSLSEMPAYFFYGCSGVENLYLTSKVDSCAENALNGLSGIKNAVWPGKIAIDNTALSSLENIIVTQGSDKLVNFFACDNINIKSVFIPDGVKSIGSQSLNDLTSLTTLRLPNTLDYIAGDAFDRLKIPEIVFPASLELIEAGAFSYAEITSVTIPEGCKTIASGAFTGCTQLKTVKILGKDTNSADGILKDCPVEELWITGKEKIKSLFSKSSAPFEEYNYVLKKVVVIGDVCEGFAEDIEKNAITEFVLTDSVKTIGKLAFSNCDVLKSINLNKVETIKDQAFLNNTTCTTINSTTTLTQVSGNAFTGSYFYNNNAQIIMGDGLLVKFTVPASGICEIPSTVKRIAAHAFSGNQTEIIVSSSVLFADVSAFSKETLTKITLQGRTQIIGSGSMFPSSTPNIYMSIDDIDYYSNANGWKNYTANFKVL